MVTFVFRGTFVVRVCLPRLPFYASVYEELCVYSCTYTYECVQSICMFSIIFTTLKINRRQQQQQQQRDCNYCCTYIQRLSIAGHACLRCTGCPDAAGVARGVGFGDGYNSYRRYLHNLCPWATSPKTRQPRRRFLRYIYIYITLTRNVNTFCKLHLVEMLLLI